MILKNILGVHSKFSNTADKCELGMVPLSIKCYGLISLQANNVLEHKSWIMLYNFPRMPTDCNLINKADHQTLSKAFLKSTKQAYTFLFSLYIYSQVGKFFTSLLQKRISDFLETNGLLSDNQGGFKKKL
jgi:hypothetical protein